MCVSSTGVYFLPATSPFSDELIQGTYQLQRQNFGSFGCTTGEEGTADEGEVEKVFADFGGSENGV
jgi:hypothetical protein